MQKLEQSEVDRRLHNKCITRIDEYKGVNTYTTIKCDICNYIWKPILYSVLNNTKVRCPHCAKNAKLTNEIVDTRLIGTSIKRIDNVKGIHTKTKCVCEVCNYKWYPSLHNILILHKGCPNCAGVAPLTNAIVDTRLVGRNIKRKGNVISSSLPITVACETCEYEWTPSLNSLLHSKSGCPQCNPLFSKLENEWLDFLQIPNTPETRQVRNLIPNKRYIMDGYIKETNTIYEFWGDRHHGNPIVYKASDISPITKTTYGELYAKTQEKRNYILENGFTLIEIWESDWKKHKHHHRVA